MTPHRPGRLPGRLPRRSPGRSPWRVPGRPLAALPLRAALLAALGPALLPGAAVPQDRGVTYTYFGTPGLLEMPSAISAAEGEIAGTVSHFAGQLRTSFSVQATDRFSATFRYSNLEGYFEDGEDYFDRSFDLRFRLTDEGRVRPMVALGLQDFLGTGLYQAEYLVATKTLGDSFRATAGLGWGRLGTAGGLGNPLGLGDRPDVTGGDEGGVPGYESYFRGDAALFGGLEYAPTETLTVKLEYSSDDGYLRVNGEPLLDRDSPLNLGVSWRPLPGVQLQGAWLYGSELAFGATLTVNTNDRPWGAGLDAPPVPVEVRAEALRAARSWDRAAEPAVTRALRDGLRTEGIELLALSLEDRAATVRYQNTRFRSEAQAMGRVARLMTAVLPPSVESFTLQPSQAGIPLVAATMSRSDLERYETAVGGTAAMLAATTFADAQGGLAAVPPVREALTWGLRPYAGLSFFGDEPVRLSLGLELSAAYRLTPALVLSGALRQEVVGTDPDGALRTSDELPVVRRNSPFFGTDGHPVIEDLTLAHTSRPGRDLYGRVTLGYLESQYAGVSGEVLWAPVRSPLALGVEVNRVAQRDFDQLLGLQDYEVTTGHASAYYDAGNGFHLQVDAGRYLAGDWGATVAVDREWENGWRVGAYATLTDVPFDVYGEGSFDKGIRVTIPFDFALGRPTRRDVDTTLSSLNRDGGARLRVEGRLYDEVRDGHLADLGDSWGRFWR